MQTDNEFTNKYFHNNYNTIQFWAQQLFEVEILEDSPFHNLAPLTKKLVWEFAGFKLDKDRF